jgi:hypothetical protein
LYSEQEGSALWTETQSAVLDAQGRYTVLLGAGSPAGLPMDMFSSGNPLWLGVWPQVDSESELPRVLMVAVPYALKAADADTLGGKPASAYLLSPATSSPGINKYGTPGQAQPTSPGLQGAGPADRNDESRVRGDGTQNFIPLWIGRRNLGNSILFQSQNMVGVGTDAPGAKLDALSGGTAVRGTSSAVGATAIVGIARATSGYTDGVYGQTASSEGSGVVGISNATTGYANGVYGQSESSSGNGVSGNATATTGFTAGVYGHSVSNQGSGVYGESDQWVGVGGMGANLGVWGDTASTSGSGVAGYADATSGNTNGVYGESASTGGNGVQGSAIATTGNAYGVNGATATQGFGAGVAGAAWAPTGNAFGVFGQTASTGGSAVFGVANATSGAPTGVVGFLDSPNGVAGQFVAHTGSGLILQGLSGSAGTQVFTVDASGNLDISGNLTVAGSKSARVKLQNGQEVALYAVESPENWFEDFGTARLQGGTAQVSLESAFLQTVDTSTDYHVFLTANGNCRGLYVANKTAAGFEVRELGGGSASVAFDYRIVAHRRGFENSRLQEVTLPQGPKDMQARFAGVQMIEHAARPATPSVTMPSRLHPVGQAH